MHSARYADRDRQVIRAAAERLPVPCWAENCQAAGTGRLGLCDEHEVEILGPSTPHRHGPAGAS